eukprot:gene15234-16808_t
MAESQVGKLLECPICFERFSDPATLPCEHSFCKQCLAEILFRKLVNKNGEVVFNGDGSNLHLVCPNCKKQHKVVKLINNSFKPSLLLKQLLDAHPAQNQQISSASKIIPCCIAECRQPGVLECLQCQELFCKKCVGNGSKLPVVCKNSGHVVVEKKEEISACLKHGISVDLYCTHCDKIICLDCFLADHKDHRTKTIKSMRNDAVSLSSKCKSISDENLRNLKQAKEKVNVKLRTLENNLQESFSALKKQQLSILNYVFMFFDEKRKELISFHEDRRQECLNLICEDGKGKIGESSDKKFVQAHQIVNSSSVPDLKVATYIAVMKRQLEKFESQMQGIEKSLTKIEHQGKQEPFSVSFDNFRPYAYGLELYERLNPKYKGIEEFFEAMIEQPVITKEYSFLNTEDFGAVSQDASLPCFSSSKTEITSPVQESENCVLKKHHSDDSDKKDVCLPFSTTQAVTQDVSLLQTGLTSPVQESENYFSKKHLANSDDSDKKDVCLPFPTAQTDTTEADKTYAICRSIRKDYGSDAELGGNASRIVYDRDFLLSFQNWTKRPEGLPHDIEIVLPADKITAHLLTSSAKPRKMYSRAVLMDEKFRRISMKPSGLQNEFPVLDQPHFTDYFRRPREPPRMQPQQSTKPRADPRSKPDDIRKKATNVEGNQDIFQKSVYYPEEDHFEWMPK